MSVEFDENKPVDYGYKQKKGGISNLLVKLGLAKDEAGSQKVMFGIIIVCLALSVYFFLKI